MNHFRMLPVMQLGIIGLAVLGVIFLADSDWTRPLSCFFWLSFTSYFFLCATSCFHETAHQTLKHRRRFDAWMGWFLGTAMGVSYTSYLETHVRHHAYLNRPEDWELWPYAQPAISLSFRRVFVWFDLIFGCWTSPMIYSRIFFSKKSSDLSEQSRRVIKLEYLVILVTWLTIGLLVLRFHYWAKFVKMWVTPLAISGILQTGRKLTEHLGMKSFDPLLGTRTVVAHPWLSRICSFLNFHIFVHGPHHTQGHVPMFPDGEVSVQTGGQTPFFRSPIFPCYQKALRQMLPYLFKNPGVGTNID